MVLLDTTSYICCIMIQGCQDRRRSVSRGQSAGQGRAHPNISAKSHRHTCAAPAQPTRVPKCRNFVIYRTREACRQFARHTRWPYATLPQAPFGIRHAFELPTFCSLACAKPAGGSHRRPNPQLEPSRILLKGASALPKPPASSPTPGKRKLGGIVWFPAHEEHKLNCGDGESPVRSRTAPSRETHIRLHLRPCFMLQPVSLVMYSTIIPNAARQAAHGNRFR
jgi:hypothetical protein